MKRSSLVAISMALLTLTNCSKSDGGSSETPFVRPDIEYDYVKTMTSVDMDDFTEVFTFTYDDQNRIEKISNTYTYTTPTEKVYGYAYNDDDNTLSISVNEYINSSPTANTTRKLDGISLNSDGTISSFRTGDSSEYTDYTFTFSDYYLSSFINKSSSSDISEELLLTWSKGNLTRIDIVDNDNQWYEYEYGSTIDYTNLNFQFYFSDLIPSYFWGAESNIWGYKSLNTISKLWIYAKGTKYQFDMADQGDADADDIVIVSYCYTFNYTFSGTKITQISIDGDVSVDGDSMQTFNAFQTYTFTYNE